MVRIGFKDALCVMLIVVAAGGCAGKQSEGFHKPTPDEVIGLRYEMAERLVAERSYDAATPLLRDLIAREPKAARLRLLMGIVLREKDVLDAAEKELRLAIELGPRDPEAHAALGVLLMKQQRYEEAERSHRKACELAPQVARFHNDLGFCLLTQRELPEAKEALLEAIRLDPTDRRAFNNLGFVYGLMDKDEEAMKAFSQAGSRAMALTNMGFVEQMRGKPVAARRYYERALRHQRGYKPALDNLRALEPGAAEDDEAPVVGPAPLEENDAEDAEDGEQRRTGALEGAQQ